MLTIINKGGARGDRQRGTILNDGVNIEETTQVRESNAELTAPIEIRKQNRAPDASSIDLIDELDSYLRGLNSFFNPRNHPLAGQERTQIFARDWKNELRIAKNVFLRSTQLVFDLARNNSISFFERVEHLDHPAAPRAAFGWAGDTAPSPQQEEAIDASEASLATLADALNDAYTLSATLCQTPTTINFQTWASAGRIFARGITGSDAFLKITRHARHRADARLHPRLLELTERLTPAALGTDVRLVFTGLMRLLEYLRIIEILLQRDYPLQPTLPIFTLIHEEANRLLKLIETRVLRTEELTEKIFEVIDGTSYAVGMELRKVFAHELVDLSALRQSPLIYAKVENSYGLLRDSFQQSIIGLAQTFDPTLDGEQLFDAFNAKLEQSIRLRNDLWTMLQLVRRTEQERDRRPFAPLLERLRAFQRGSMRYLMYKDWEAYERFVEEASAARGAVELAPVLHRFGTYLETLFGQINMRATLAAHPFEHPPVVD